MEGIAPILLRFVVACSPRAWSVRCPCALVWVRPPVATPAGEGGGACGGARRGGPAALPPGCPGSCWGRGGTPSAAGGGGGPAPPRPAGRGGWGGRGRGERRRPLPPCSGAVGTPLGYTRSAGVAGQPWALGAPWSASGGSVWQGGGGSLCRGLLPPALCIVLVLRVHNKPFCPCAALQNQIVLNEFLHSN